MQDTSTFQEGGPFWTAVAEAAQLLEDNPAEAETRLLRLLQLAPGQPQALQLLVDVHRANGDLAGARALLERMVAELPKVASVHYELGLLLTDMGESEQAIRLLSRVVELEPKHPQAWRILGDLLAEKDDLKGAATAYSRQFESAVGDLKTLEQVAALGPDQAEVAESVLREYLNIYPTDLAGLEMLGSLHMRIGGFETAEELFKRSFELAPSFARGRMKYILALHQQLRPEEEISHIDLLLESDPGNPDYRVSKATALSASGRAQEAVEYCEEMLRAEPDRPQFWLTYAQALRTAGRQQDCIAAFRKTLQLQPRYAAAWWGLGNLKTFHFSSADVDAIRAELARANVTAENREFLHFALGEALEDLKAYREAFESYRAGNAVVRARNPYDLDEVLRNMEREKRRFTPEFYAACQGLGCPSSDPIFIFGLPRSGSTLIEQILASHSAVEGCGELPSLVAALRSFVSQRSDEAENEELSYPNPEDINALGEDYLNRCRPFRKLERPRFTDKMPTNFRHVGLIAAILPNAKIIDARRHPLACCFSNFKQVFPFRHGPSYDLTDIGRYYRAYVELLAHFDRVLPGRIHRVFYEELVEKPEQVIRELLQHCGLPFEDRCLRFYETERGVRTISSEQVRKPLYKDAVEKWRHFDPWLGPLKAALGPVLQAYPALQS